MVKGDSIRSHREEAVGRRGDLVLLRSMYNYLRISVTDRCNLNCIYCLPREQVKFLPHADILRYEEIAIFVEIVAGLGVKHVRLTGGEPLVRKDVAILVEKLKGIAGIEGVSMTTNGLLFFEQAKRLKAAGLDRVNFSLDTLKPDRFEKITGTDTQSAGEHVLEKVWRSIMKAIELDFLPVKLNVVLFRGISDDEIFDFAELTRKHDLTVRFIEYMGPSDRFKYVPNDEVLGKLESRFACHPRESGDPVSKHVKTLSNDTFLGHGPAKYISLEGARGRIGFISPNTDCFCDSCNRLRLSSDGKLYPCLSSAKHLDVRRLLRNGADMDKIRSCLLDMMSAKAQFSYKQGGGGSPADLDMCYIGG